MSFCNKSYGFSDFSIAVIIKRFIKMHRDPYSSPVFTGTGEFKEAMKSAEQQL
ncbi:MAG: hypothetical protein IKO51_03880 [Clostridia bacterium]|nr:hypothetical protein [Clostridia bacterium]